MFTPLLQRFPLSFNIVQGFILCVAGDTLFQVCTRACVCVCGTLVVSGVLSRQGA